VKARPLTAQEVRVYGGGSTVSLPVRPVLMNSCSRLYGSGNDVHKAASQHAVALLGMMHDVVCKHREIAATQALC
jgi:hypothetical protein